MTSQPQSVTLNWQPKSQVIESPVQHDSSDPQGRRKKIIYRLGVAEVLLGVLLLILAIAATVITAVSQTSSYAASTAIVGGLSVCITGRLGILVKTTPTRCKYIANLTMAICVAYVSCVVAILCGIYGFGSNVQANLAALHITIAVLGTFCVIVTLIHAAFCCGRICCKSNSVATEVIPKQIDTSTESFTDDQKKSGQFFIANQAFPLRGMMNFTHTSMKVPVSPHSHESKLFYASEHSNISQS